MDDKGFKPQHINADKDDFMGNDGIGRIVLLPGSDGRARKISERWKGVEVKEHPRMSHLYKGKLTVHKNEIDVAVISTGMGAPSADIIINELKALGAKNFIRVGTAGSLQPRDIRCGQVVVPTGSVRDESTTSRYLPVEVPAIPSLPFLLAAYEASEMLKEQMEVRFGVVHSKDSLYAREFLYGPKKKENEEYMQTLKKSGVLASEMETSLLFSLGMVFNSELGKAGRDEYITGAILAIIGDDEPFGDSSLIKVAENHSIRFCEQVVYLLTTKILRNFTLK